MTLNIKAFKGETDFCCRFPEGLLKLQIFLRLD